MTNAMHKKALRDLRRRRSQVGAIAAMVMLGVSLFVASYDSFGSLQASYDYTYIRTHFADLTATGGVAEDLAAVARESPGVARVATRTQADLPMTIETTKLVGRAVGMPEGENTVNTIDLISGTLPAAGQVAVERHTAETFGLSTGSSIGMFDGAHWRAVTVSGVVISPEYLWPARSRQDILADPHTFAVVFTTEPFARTLTTRHSANQTLVQMNSATTSSDRDAVAARLRAAGATSIETRADQPSDSALMEGLKGVSAMAVGFPALFLTAAAIAEFVLITRVVQTERAVIGTLLALGARRTAVARHYTAYAAMIAAAAALFGIAAGIPLTSAYTAHYTAVLSLPDTVIQHRLPTAVIGFALGVAAGAIGGLAAAIGAARSSPAEAMRGNPVRQFGGGALTRWSTQWTRLPVAARMALRSLARSRRRTAATMIGCVLACVLILAAAGMLTSVRSMLDVEFGWVQRQDATVLLASASDAVGRQLHSIPGVDVVESTTVARVTVSGRGHSYATALSGFEPTTVMHRFRDADGAARALPADGILAGAALADKLGLHVGDEIVVTAADGAPHRIRLSGLVDEPLGTSLYATNSVAHTVVPAGSDGYLLHFAKDADRSQVRATATGIAGVVAYADNAAVQQKIESYLLIFWVFAAVMLALGALLAFTVIYVTMSVNLADRTVELATLRAAGASTRRLTAVVAIENIAATLLATPFGLAAGVGAAWLFLRSYNNDLFSLHLSLSPAVLIAATVAVVAAAAVSQFPAGRMINRIDIARVIRERSQ